MNVLRPEIRTGILVIFSLVALVGTILYLGAPGVFRPMNTYWIYAENAGGIRQGNEVMLAGRRIGQVVRLYSPVPEAQRPDPKLETLIEVRANASAVIYREVNVLLTQNGLLGEMLIDFTSGVEASGIAEDGASFVAVRPPGMDQAVPMVLERIDPALRKVTETLESLQETAGNLTKLTAEDGEVAETLAEFRKLGTSLNDLADVKGSLRLSLENLERLTGEEGKLNQSLSNLTELTGPKSDLAETIRNAEEFTAKLTDNHDIERTLRNFRTASEQMNVTMRDLGQQFGAIGTNLEEATDTVKRQPWRLIWPTTKKYPDDPPRGTARTARSAPATSAQRTQRPLREVRTSKNQREITVERRAPLKIGQRRD